MSLIHIQNLSKHFKILNRLEGLGGAFRDLFPGNDRTVEAVTGITFDIEPGEIVGYSGPNAAGKSTTIKMMTGILKPTGGVIEVNGRPPYDNRIQQAQIMGVVFGAKLPAAARTPVVPMLIGTRTIPWDKSTAPIYAGFPWQMLGAWPLPDQPLAVPFAALSGIQDQLVVEGAQAKIGDASVPFRPLAPEMFAPGKSLLEYSMLNYIQAAPTYALNTTNLFTGTRPARGLFASVLDNRRAWLLKADVPQEARLWLNGQPVKQDDYIQLQPAYYAFISGRWIAYL